MADMSASASTVFQGFPLTVLTWIAKLLRPMVVEPPATEGICNSITPTRNLDRIQRFQKGNLHRFHPGAPFPFEIIWFSGSAQNAAPHRRPSRIQLPEGLSVGPLPSNRTGLAKLLRRAADGLIGPGGRHTVRRR